MILEIFLSILLSSSEPHGTITRKWAGGPTPSSACPGWGHFALSSCLVQCEKLYLWEGQHRVPSLEMENESSASLLFVVFISMFLNPASSWTTVSVTEGALEWLMLSVKLFKITLAGVWAEKKAVSDSLIIVLRVLVMGKWEIGFWENLVRIIQVGMLQGIPFPEWSRKSMGCV